MLKVASDGRERRLARNQALFREVNERINSLAISLAPSRQWQFEIVCECSNESCTSLVDVTLDEYERVRSSPERFFVCPGHDIPEIESVVDRKPGYVVVEKQGDAADVVRTLDPRGRGTPR